MFVNRYTDTYQSSFSILLLNGVRVCGKISGEWWLSKKWGYAASVALIPYTILKTLWVFGVPIVVSENGVEALQASMRTNADSVSCFLYSYGVELTDGNLYHNA
ncbi:hypothetical protein DJ93_5668 [Bacillus clarus]|uniref:Uncharacterized protein n=1 Tax=Bacillus clarus TaxID=2338372 RepID=A0A090YSD2_9BACI|nr:hypothetical protein DJ93_5668 [Bacillus clarus]